MLNFLGPKSAFWYAFSSKRGCVHAHFDINADSKRRFKTHKKVRLRSPILTNHVSWGSINAESHINAFKWRHLNAFPVQVKMRAPGRYGKPIDPYEYCAMCNMHVYCIRVFCMVSVHAWTARHRLQLRRVISIIIAPVLTMNNIKGCNYRDDELRALLLAWAEPETSWVNEQAHAQCIFAKSALSRARKSWA